MAVFGITMQLIYVSMAIMQVATSVTFWQVFRCYFLLLVCWWIILLTIVQVAVSVAAMQLQVSAAPMQVTVSATNIWVTIFMVIMQMGDSLAIMQMVFSVLYYAHDCLVTFLYSYVGDSSK